MKKTLIMAIAAAMLLLVFYLIPGKVDSKSSATGIIEACWSPTCSRPVDTKVQLVDKYGNIWGECEIVPPATCCKIKGDFPTGYYHFVYYQSGSTTRCKSVEFYYYNGTDITQSVICLCP